MSIVSEYDIMVVWQIEVGLGPAQGGPKVSTKTREKWSHKSCRLLSRLVWKKLVTTCLS